ncbi:MAG: hypothetical protein A2X13_04755 [Bacteroidetes bacterium GWC2_33_15]|nr:MAG: hypothetical protein A2X10_06600 [Bacteroidetes bacterium GWA2_33_15]OFX49835.1 MAG: hypothetical protein A2X13_04755 [Bacteroidetes bacterium GWC2_33_15]OFX65026.1 MAG: hypothetical protein A2X15_06675 [Bacteroidetes bacterium GWB2_32_14]OFX69012.1 MAG: hypothetical protein A2X14_13480 [Bacteroidetes bacterium GWD2_33_33]HAN18278.1 nuclear pore complex subunit [Bacteroidales bacterium]
MDPLSIGATEVTPGINFDKQLNKFLMFGKSFPEESKRFFTPILVWLEEYVKSPNEITTFEFRMDYYNSSTSTMILEMLYVLERIQNKGKQVTIVWNYLATDDDMLDAGHEYSEMVKIPFEYNEIEDY